MKTQVWNIPHSRNFVGLSFSGCESEEAKLVQNVPLERSVKDRNKHFRVNSSTTPPSPKSVESSKCGEEPEEKKIGTNVLLPGPVIRPCQGRPNTFDGSVTEVTGSDDDKDILRRMKKQVWNIPPSRKSVRSSFSGCEPEEAKLVQNVPLARPVIRPC